MPYDRERHHRRSIRLQGYDYAQAGEYFVTICVKDRACLLGNVTEGEMRLSRAGQIVEAGWFDLPRRFPSIEIDAFVVMPNHVHGIVLLGTAPTPGGEGAMNRAPTEAVGRHRNTMAGNTGRQTAASEGRRHGVGARFIAPSPQAPTPRFPAKSTRNPDQSLDLGEVIRAFKAVTSRQIRVASRPSFSWQRNYYERIIRNDHGLERARVYIIANPARWAEDPENSM
jgi:REP element-mobilizing transposase RayT